MVRFYGTSVPVLMAGTALIALGCEEPPGAGAGTGGGARPEASAAEEEAPSDFGKPERRFEQPDDPRPLESPAGDRAATGADEPLVSGPEESPDAGGSSFPELPAGDADSKPPSTTERDAAQRPAADASEN